MCTRCTLPVTPQPIALLLIFFFFQAEDGIRDYKVTGVQTCALPISRALRGRRRRCRAQHPGRKIMTPDLMASLYVFLLAAFVGLEVIRRVSPLLHTPLMSLTNALSAIAVVGAIVIAGEQRSTLATVLGTLAVIASTTNVVGGFLITYRMLKMFKTRERTRS